VLRLICTAFQTPPIYTLEIEAAIPPLDIHLATVKQNTAIRLIKIPLLSPITQRLPNKWCRFSLPSIPPPILTNNNQRTNSPKKTSLLKLASQHDHNREKISSTIPPWTNMAEKFKGRLTILNSTCPNDKREETAKKRALSVRAHANDQTLLTIYTLYTQMDPKQKKGQEQVTLHTTKDDQ
jgi:hypothetical protein